MRRHTELSAILDSFMLQFSDDDDAGHFGYSCLHEKVQGHLLVNHAQTSHDMSGTLRVSLQ